MFDTEFLFRRKLSKLKVCTGEFYDFLIEQRDDLPGKITMKNFTLIIKIKLILLETGKGLREKEQMPSKYMQHK